MEPKNSFVGEGSARVSRGRTFIGSVEQKNRFLSISSRLSAISNLPNLFWKFRIELIFLECTDNVQIEPSTTNNVTVAENISYYECCFFDDTAIHQCGQTACRKFYRLMN